ncbi:hypothetical protein Droror1_Dr00008725 [Drosera rotundifolia]
MTTHFSYPLVSSLNKLSNFFLIHILPISITHYIDSLDEIVLDSEDDVGDKIHTAVVPNAIEVQPLLFDTVALSTPNNYSRKSAPLFSTNSDKGLKLIKQHLWRKKSSTSTSIGAKRHRVDFLKGIAKDATLNDEHLHRTELNQMREELIKMRKELNKARTELLNC